MPRLNEFDDPDEEHTCGQTATSAAFLLIHKLESNLSSKYVCPLGDRKSFVNPFEKKRDPLWEDALAPQILNLVNWTALFLARPDHKTTAVLIVVEQEAFNFVVAIGKAKVDDVDRRQSQRLLSCIHQAITRHENHKAAETPKKEFADSEYRRILTTIAEDCWAMIAHRLNVLKATVSAAGGIEALVNLWATTSFGTLEESKAVLKEKLEALLSTPELTEADTIEMRVECFLEAIQACTELVDRHFIPKLDDDTWTASVPYMTHKTLDKLYQDIHSIYDYHFTTTGVIAEGVAVLIENFPKLTEQSFECYAKVVWSRDFFGTSLNSECTWERSPETFLDEILTIYESSRLCTPKNNAHKQKLLSHCANVWEVGTGISAHVHPEIELFFYVMRKDQYPMSMALGTDSELCFACGIYFERLDDRFDIPWKTRWSSPNKVEEDWLLPPVGNKAEKLEGAVNKKAEKVAGLLTSFEVRIRLAFAIDAYLKKN